MEIVSLVVMSVPDPILVLFIPLLDRFHGYVVVYLFRKMQWSVSSLDHADEDVELATLDSNPQK